MTVAQQPPAKRRRTPAAQQTSQGQQQPANPAPVQQPAGNPPAGQNPAPAQPNNGGDFIMRHLTAILVGFIAVLGIVLVIIVLSNVFGNNPQGSGSNIDAQIAEIQEKLESGTVTKSELDSALADLNSRLDVMSEDQQQRYDDLLVVIKSGDNGSSSDNGGNTDNGDTTSNAGDNGSASSSDIGESFNPVPDYEQSCEPQRREGCTWDVGARGATMNESLRRVVNQVSIVKGVKIEWNGNTARALKADNGENRCSIVVIPTNSWLENLTVWDANVTTYYVWGGDVDGWMKTLAVQAAYEQSANYGCPTRSWPQDFDIWDSNISSPPDGYDSQDNAASPAPSDNSGGNTQPQPTDGDSSCETVNCGDRKTTADNGGTLKFSAGEAVYGWEIKINGKKYNDCYFESAPDSGTVTDGVVYPWKTEVKNARACSK